MRLGETNVFYGVNLTLNNAVLMKASHYLNKCVHVQMSHYMIKGFLKSVCMC